MLHALAIAAALSGSAVAQADDNGCDFQAPSPVLKAHAYAGQSFKPGPDQTAVETAKLGGGVLLTINQNACVDEVEQEFVLTAPNDSKKQGFAAWADFARSELGGLKLSDDAWAMTELADFLTTARTMTPKDGVVVMCRHGEVEDGYCSWESGGTLRIEVKPGATTTQVTVFESISG